MPEFVRKFRAWLDALEKPYGWVCVELNDPAVDATNRALLPQLVSECERDGTIAAGPWMTRDFTAAMARAAVTQCGAHLFVAEGEIPAQMIDSSGNVVSNPQAQDWADLAFHLSDLGIDRAVATSWAPFQKYVWSTPGGEQLPTLKLVPAPEFAKPLTDDDWYVLPYVYPAETPTHSVAGAKQYAQHYPDWAGHEEPVLGTYSGPFGDFGDLDSAPFTGRDTCAGWSVWDAGEQF